MTVTLSGKTAVCSDLSARTIEKAMKLSARRISCRKFKGLFLQVSRSGGKAYWRHQVDGRLTIIGNWPEIPSGKAAMTEFNATPKEDLAPDPLAELLRKPW